MRGALTIAAYALRESTRRRVFVVVLLLTLAFLALYAVGAEAAFDSIDAQAAGAAFDVDDQVLTHADAVAAHPRVRGAAHQLRGTREEGNEIAHSGESTA